MGNIRRGVRKGIVLALSAAMTLGLTSTFMGESNEVAAANTNGNPEGWLTKTELMTGDTSGNMKIYMGKNGNGADQAWYVLGKDSGVNGDNMVLLNVGYYNNNATVKFNTSTADITYSSGDMGTYADDSSITSVSAGHYGASNLRKTIKGFETDTKYFNTTEQGDLNATTVTTEDITNNMTYTTSDKLYAPVGYWSGGVPDEKKSETLYLGSSEDILFQMKNDVVDTIFWMRNSRKINGSEWCLAGRTTGIIGSFTADASMIGLKVATNYNLQNVLFAVPFTVTNDTIETNGAKTIDSSTEKYLRYDGAASGWRMAEVTYNSITEKATVVKQGGTAPNSQCAVVYGTLKSGETGYLTFTATTGREEDLSAFDFTKPIKVWVEGIGTEGNMFATNPDDTKDTAKTYNITEGANSSWTKDSNKTLTITGDGAYADFTEVRVDGTAINASNYTTKEGSTIVTLKADYLNSLSVGSHSFEIYWNDGKASTTFTVAAASVNPNPGTNPGGDNQNPGGDNTGNNGNNGSNGVDNSGNTGNTGANTGANANNGTTIGDNNTWDKNTNTDLVVKPGNTIKEVTEVKIDGTTLDSKDYTLGSDGNITISKDYLKKLTNGNHTLQILGKGANGESLTISAGFVVKNSNALAPKTGETFLPYLWLASVALMLSVLASIVYDLVKAGRKRRA